MRVEENKKFIEEAVLPIWNRFRHLDPEEREKLLVDGVLPEELFVDHWDEDERDHFIKQGIIPIGNNEEYGKLETQVETSSTRNKEDT